MTGPPISIRFGDLLPVIDHRAEQEGRDRSELIRDLVQKGILSTDAQRLSGPAVVRDYFRDRGLDAGAIPTVLKALSELLEEEKAPARKAGRTVVRESKKEQGR